MIAEEARRDRFGHFNLLHLESDARADIYLSGQDALVRRGLDSRRFVRLASIEVPLASPEYVILHKLRFRQQGAGERHFRDVRSILRLMQTDIDLTRLRAEAEAEGLAAEWREMEQGG